MTARGIRAQVEGAYRRFALAARVWEGVRTRADERRGEAGSVGCSWRIAAKVKGFPTKLVIFVYELILGATRASEGGKKSKRSA